MKKAENKNPWPKYGEIINYFTTTKKEKGNEISDVDKNELFNILLESVWISRWKDEKMEALYAVLTSDEAMKIVKDIFSDLDKNGYKIVKK